MKYDFLVYIISFWVLYPEYITEKKRQAKMIFLDNNSTTPIDTDVFEAMKPYLKDIYGNPHSIHHELGYKSRDAVEDSRRLIAEILNVEDNQVIFTSGATESNNLFIKGAMLRDIQEGRRKKKIFCSNIEHKCVLDSCLSGRDFGYDVNLIPVHANGEIDIDFLKKYADNDTLLISVMTVNNETGLRINIEEINQFCKTRNILFHTDMAQSLIGEKFDLGDLNAEGVSLSGHKIHGPKGIGLLISNKEPTAYLNPLMHGGLQEQSIRSGTVPVFLTVGIAKAMDILTRNHHQNKIKIQELRKIFVSHLSNIGDNIEINYSSENGHPGLVNMPVREIEADIFCTRVGNRLAISTAAACTGANYEYSYVLKNMGLSDEKIKTSFRICFGRQNNKNEAKKAAEIINSELGAYRKVLSSDGSKE